MFDRLLMAIEPFALTLIILAGASLAGWLDFTDAGIVGVATVFVGVLLVIKHVTQTVRTPKVNGES